MFPTKQLVFHADGEYLSWVDNTNNCLPQQLVLLSLLSIDGKLTS